MHAMLRDGIYYAGEYGMSDAVRSALDEGETGAGELYKELTACAARSRPNQRQHAAL
jgi:hypothetical protein